MTLESTIKGFDLFSLPFQFQMKKDEKEKRTIQGGIISFLIIATSLSYLIYLTILYFSNSLQPKIATFDQFSSTPYKMQMHREQIRFQLNLSDGTSILQYQQNQQKVYLTVIGQLNGVDSNGQYYSHYVPMMACDSSNISYCFYFTDNSQFTELEYNSDETKKSALYIFLSQCIPTLLGPNQVCATPEESNKVLINLANVVKLEMHLNQYNTNQKVFQNKTQIEYYLLDSNTSFMTQIILKQENTSVKDGFIIQTQNKSSYIQDYQRIDLQLSKDYLFNAFQFNLYGVVLISAGGSISISDVQFPMYTEVLAQFSSVLNTLLLLGMFLKVIAQSEIMQDLAQIQLQHYYKKAAYKLLSEKEIAQFENKGVTSIIELNKYITTLDFQKKWKEQYNLNFFKNEKKQNEKGSEQQKFFNNLAQKTNSFSSIQSIQKELLQIKTILKIILSPQQYAAISLCGCDMIDSQEHQEKKEDEVVQATNKPKDIGLNKPIDIEANNNNININNDNNNQDILILGSERKDLITQTQWINTKQKMDTFDAKEEINAEQTLKGSGQQMKQFKTGNNQFLNHLEKVDMVENDPIYFKECVEQFIQKIKQADSQQIPDSLNQRIYDCMIQIDQLKPKPFPQGQQLQQIQLEKEDINSGTRDNNKLIEQEIVSYPLSPLTSMHRQQNQLKIQ